MTVRAKTCLAVVLSVGGFLGFTQVAQAYGPCDSGHFCAYSATNFNDSYPHYEWFGYVTNWPTAIDDDEDSVWNNGTSNAPVRVYDSIDWADPHYCVYRTHRLNLPDNKDNDGNSHKWTSGISGCF